MGASYYLAVHTPLGVVGVAYGTVIAQYSGLLLAVLILVFKYHIVHIGLREIIASMKGSEVRRMMALNGNLIIRSLCFMVVYVGYTSLASQYGDTQLAVSSIMMKLFMFFSFFVDGFAYAGEALVGKAVGEGRTSVSDIVSRLFLWSLGVGGAFTMIYAIWGDDCIRMLTTDLSVLMASDTYIGWLIAMPMISTLAFMWDGIYVGATAGIQIRNSMIWAAVAFVIVYIIGIWLTPENATAPLMALFAAYFAHLLARVIYLSAQWKQVPLQRINK
jgi:MATE family multidrug resistance protein